MIKIKLTENEAYLISSVFQNYYHMGLEEMAKEDSRIESIFKKMGFLEGENDN